MDSNQDKSDKKTTQPEEFDFSELQGLTCGPEGCKLPEDFYNRKNDKKENDKD